MLHYYGDITAMDLAFLARDYLILYVRDGKDTTFVPFKDLRLKKRRFVKFEYLAGQWVYVDLVDVEK